MVMSEVNETVRINPGSDGHDSKWPNAGLRREDPAIYLSKLAVRWMQDRGEFVPGTRYNLDRLPSGYALFGKTRQANPKNVDRYLYGHPTYTFRSSEEFYPHFKSLMDHGTAQGCKCLGCVGGRRSKPDLPSATPRPGPRQALSAALARSSRETSNLSKFEAPIRDQSSSTPSHAYDVWIKRPATPTQDMIDEEGSPDVFRLLVNRLREAIVLEEPIVQSKSFDWIIHHKATASLIKDMLSRPAFEPREGELVLFVRNHRSAVSISEPQVNILWEAGVITDVSQGPVDNEDLVREDPKRSLGFRIEPMSPPGSKEKHWSKRVATVPMSATRPFALYREVLKGIKPKNYHATVQHALTVMSSISLISPSYFKGLWPTATVFCQGIYIGSELILVGDTVRLMPSTHQDTSKVWDVMHITSIKLKMFHLDAQVNADYDDPTSESTSHDRHHDCCIHIDGIAFTIDQSRAWKGPNNAESLSLPPAILGYGSWYPLHDPKRRWKVPFSRILGRCYEHIALTAWLGTDSPASVQPGMKGFAQINQHNDSIISKGLQGTMGARTFSTGRDPRMESSPGKTWFWADHRVEQLDLHEVKGQVVSAHIHGEPVRDIRAWKRAMSIREKGAGNRPKSASDASGVRRGRPPKAGGSMLAASAVGAAADEGLGGTTVDEDEEEGTSESMNGDIPMEDAQDEDEEEDQEGEEGSVEGEAQSDDDDLNAFSDERGPIIELD